MSRWWSDESVGLGMLFVAPGARHRSMRAAGRGAHLALWTLLSLSLLNACGDDDSGAPGDGDGGAGAGDETPLIDGLGGGSGDGDGDGDGDGLGGAPTLGPYELPSDFTATESGGYKLGVEIQEGDSIEELIGSADECDYQILGVVRDFKRGDRDGGHPDFETFTGSGEQGIVEDELGSDGKPVYVAGDHKYTTTEENFDQWYRNTDGVNRAFLTYFSLEPSGDGDVLTFRSNAFFPLDEMGWGNEEKAHNFGFTTEVHTRFLYRGGETFSFTGDDDLWVFINERLAIDLGGVHPQQSEEVALDDLGEEFALEVGKVYPLDLFHAERHTGQSNFRVDTTLSFVDCGTIVDDAVVR